MKSSVLTHFDDLILAGNGESIEKIREEIENVQKAVAECFQLAHSALESFFDRKGSIKSFTK